VIKAAIYTRVSTEEQAAEGYSLGDQERQALAKIKREGWSRSAAPYRGSPYLRDSLIGERFSPDEVDERLAALATA
jgi:DNA invertase Pin-like site-specific DNA recombinase